MYSNLGNRLRGCLSLWGRLSTRFNQSYFRNENEN